MPSCSQILDLRIWLTSIPHLEPADVEQIRIVRLDAAVEREIADAAEEAARLRDEANQLDNGISADADRVIELFLAEGIADRPATGSR